MNSGRWEKNYNTNKYEKRLPHYIRAIDGCFKKKNGKGYEELGNGKQDFEGWKSNSL